MTKLLYSLLSGHVIPRPSLKLSVIPADDDDDDDDEASYNGDDRPFQSCLSLDGMMNIEMLDQEMTSLLMMSGSDHVLMKMAASFPRMTMMLVAPFFGI
jgi:hypothetical protein